MVLLPALNDMYGSIATSRNNRRQMPSRQLCVYVYARVAFGGGFDVGGRSAWEWATLRDWLHAMAFVLVMTLTVLT
jgi:hypothetical protein